MIDLFVFLVLVGTIWLLLQRGYAAQTVNRGLRSKIALAFFALTGILLVQLYIVWSNNSAQGGSVLTSIGYVFPFFLNMLYSFIVLVAVCAVIYLGITLSREQFAIWKDSQAELVNAAKTSREELKEYLEAIASYPNSPAQGRSQRLVDDKLQEIEAVTNALTSQVEISAKGIKIVTPFIGLAILVVSLGFLFLFLRYVIVAPPH